MPTELHKIPRRDGGGLEMSGKMDDGGSSCVGVTGLSSAKMDVSLEPVDSEVIMEEVKGLAKKRGIGGRRGIGGAPKRLVTAIGPGITIGGGAEKSLSSIGGNILALE